VVTTLQNSSVPICGRRLEDGSVYFVNGDPTSSFKSVTNVVFFNCHGSSAVIVGDFPDNQAVYAMANRTTKRIVGKGLFPPVTSTNQERVSP
jgi:hypothetical protein